MKRFISLMASLAFSIVFVTAAQATEIRFQPVPNGVAVTLIDLDATEDAPPPGALHCLTGTRYRWASTDGGQTFSIGQMIGGCHRATVGGQVTHVIHETAVNSRGVLCLIPVWVDRRGRRISYSSHPDGETNKVSRKGGMITALARLSDGSYRPATTEEALSCD